MNWPKQTTYKLMTGALALALFGAGCGESTSSGTGLGTGPGQTPDATDPGQETVVTTEEYTQYLDNADKWAAEQPYIVAPWSKQLTAAVSSQATVTPTSVSFPVVAGVDEYEVGDILVSSNVEANKVFLRRILAVTQQGDQVVFATENASITDVVLGGSVTEMPTGVNPDLVDGANSFQTMTQQIGLGSVFPTISNLRDNPEDEGGLSSSAPSGFQWKIEPVVEGPSLSAPNTGMDLDAKIASSWWDRLTDAQSSGIRVGKTNGNNGIASTRTRCSAVVGALEFIKGRESDQRTCKAAYDTWIDSSGYPTIPGAALGNGVTRVRTEGVSRLSCNDVDGGWAYFDKEIYMPYPEEVAWARSNCNGVLEEFDMNARFDPRFGLDKARLKFEASYSREALPGEVIKQRDAFLSKDTWKVFWIGWFPVVVRFEGKIIAGFYKFNAKGNVEVGFDNIEAGIDAQLNLHFNGGELTNSNNWSGSSSLEPVLNGDWFFEGTLEGSVERDFVGVEGGVYFYDLLGPYLVPASIYGRVDAAVGVSTEARELCNFGITGGVKGQVGVKGRVPFTGYEAEWKLWEYDSCGSGPRNAQAFYEQDTNFCLKHCINSNPLRVELTWDAVTDLDLAIIDPNGTEISFDSPNIAGAIHANPNGCFQDMCEEGDNSERVTWGSVPAGGDYQIKVTNFSGSQSAPFTITVKGQRQNGEVYFNETFNGTAEASERHESEFSFSLRPER